MPLLDWSWMPRPPLTQRATQSGLLGQNNTSYPSTIPNNKPNYSTGMPVAMPGQNPIPNPFQKPPIQAPQTQAQPQPDPISGLMPQAKTSQSMTWNIPTGMEAPAAPQIQQFTGFNNIPMGMDQPPQTQQFGGLNNIPMGTNQPAAPQTQQFAGFNNIPQAHNLPGEQYTSMPANYPDPLRGAAPGAGGQGSMVDFMTKYMGDTRLPTVEEVQSNMNPYLDQILAKGNKAIESSAAARGGLMSSGTINRIGEWTTGATSQAYNDAEARLTQNQRTKLDQGLAAWNMANGDRTFDANQVLNNWNMANGDRTFEAGQVLNNWNMANGDRNFLAGRYDTGFSQNMAEKNFDADWTQWQNMFEADNYWKSADAYNNLMTAKEARDKGLASVGVDASGKAVELTTGSASAIANLATSLATFKALAAQGQGEADAGAVDGIIGAITSFLGISG